MWTLYTKDPEHWIPIQTVASFKRMRDYKSMGDEWVVKALRLSEELEVDESGTKVRRRSEIQEPKGQFERSVYAVRCSLHSLSRECLRFNYVERVSR
jgi:lupus La protein